NVSVWADASPTVSGRDGDHVPDAVIDDERARLAIAHLVEQPAAGGLHELHLLHAVHEPRIVRATDQVEALFDDGIEMRGQRRAGIGCDKSGCRAVSGQRNVMSAAACGLNWMGLLAAHPQPSIVPFACATFRAWRSAGVALEEADADGVAGSGIALDGGWISEV